MQAPGPIIVQQTQQGNCLQCKQGTMMKQKRWDIWTCVVCLCVTPCGLCCDCAWGIKGVCGSCGNTVNC